MIQIPSPGEFLLKWRGDSVTIELKLDAPRRGHAFFRTDLKRLGHWKDLPMVERAPGEWTLEVKLEQVGVFSGKAGFFPEGGKFPEWPEGANLGFKVESEVTRSGNSIYCVFPRQFGSFRQVERQLDFIMGTLGFNIVQTLPPFPVPTSYAVMGEYGCPFAATDFYSVDPALAEFDEFATPLDQFRQLIRCVHARKGRFFVDLPANHTGWASTLQLHHPEWFRHEADGRFHSPGAWGVKWADLVELDYSHAELWEYMAKVFLFWCRNGVDGFRCDAGYMIPLKVWRHIVCKVRAEYPDTVFLLEGLGGELSVTDSLLSTGGLDWAYSEIFQIYDRGQFEWYLPSAIARSERYGTLVNFAETHDNDRLAKGGEVYAQLRVQLAALLSWQGAWGIANGVEWFATEKIDVHGKSSLNWGSPRNMVALISKLNHILATHPSFAGAAKLKVITRGTGNTLAVLRNDDVLVLANLNCQNAAVIDWDRREFPYDEAYDLVSERRVVLAGEVRLAPGEVWCAALPRKEPAVEEMPEREECFFRWVYPRDLKREFVIPEKTRFRVSAPHHFRAQVVDPLSGVTLSCVVSDARNEAVAGPFEYVGDGTGCRRLQFEIEEYDDDSRRIACERSVILVPPPASQAKVKLTMWHDELQKLGNVRSVLSNGAGAAAQVRAAWATIESQYDALLAANPHPDYPTDRLNLWSRLRGWMQHDGYSHEFNAKHQLNFSVDPSGRFCKWQFVMPCGLGRTAELEAELSLVPEVNAARLTIRRVAARALDVGDGVRLVLRPDIEWRSFHSTTKAFAGLERRFPEAVKARRNGFDFAPYDRVLRFTASAGEFHHEAEWTYNVQHSEEAARGQDGAGDLFSPGWFEAELNIGDSVTLLAELLDSADVPSRVDDEVPDPIFNFNSRLDFVGLLEDAMQLYIVRRDDLKTVIAGYPWFLDWGRDTFIFMRGMLAAGLYADSAKILRAFAAFEQDGTLPNIIYGDTAGNRDTTDAQLWFIRCVQEIGDRLCGENLDELKRVCESIVDHYIKGTPNGIRMDPESGLVWSPSHFTWMDTNYPACTPRVGYPIEIQALWISALRFLGRNELAAKALDSVRRYFGPETTDPDRTTGYADCLDAQNGESAAQARPDRAVRPNQLFLITLGILNDRSIVDATSELVIPGGLRSLGASDSRYRGIYAGDEDTCRKPAYHNGTVWAWPFPSFAEALVMTGVVPREAAFSLLASAVDNLNRGCMAHLSENADGDAPHAQKGCTAQAWSVSELLRVWHRLLKWEEEK